MTLPIRTAKPNSISRNCRWCGEPTSSVCPYCSSSFLPADREYICSEQCLAECNRTGKHRARRCGMGMFWQRVQVTAHTWETGIEQIVLDIAKDLEVDSTASSMMIRYLKAVSFKHRSRTLGPKDFRLRDDVLQSIKSIKARFSSKHEYIVARQASETEKETDTIRAGNEYQLRPDRRPWSADKKRGRSGQEGIELYTFDFESLSLFDWADGFSDSNKLCTIDPWSTKIEPFEVDELRFSKW